jgi:hypothetical protein
MPLGYAHVWDWFLQLSRTRSIGFAVGAVSYSEIAAWSCLTGYRPTPFEVTLLTDMDTAFITQQARLKAKGKDHG